MLIFELKTITVPVLLVLILKRNFFSDLTILSVIKSSGIDRRTDVFFLVDIGGRVKKLSKFATVFSGSGQYIRIRSGNSPNPKGSGSGSLIILI
jgi:hypothetical protein